MGAEKRLECFDKLSMNGNSRDLDIVVLRQSKKSKDANQKRIAPRVSN